MKLPQSFNLHSHTYRCGHALGEDEDYLLHAQMAGFTELGFSDHVFLPEIYQPTIRGNYEQLPEYIESLNKLKEKYRGQMKVHIGFEAEWLGEKYVPYYRELLESGKVAYLALGQHGFYDDGSIHWYAMLPPNESLRRYRDDLIAGMDSGLFLFVCHPDTFLRWHGAFDEEARQVSIDICKAAKRNNIPLEINLSYGRISIERLKEKNTILYPCPMFWDIASEIGVDCIYGVDAHNPSDYQTTPYVFFVQFAKEHKLKMLSTSPLKNGEKR